MSYAKHRGGAGTRDYRDLLQIVTGESSGDAGLQDSTPGMSCQDSIPHANLRGADLRGADLRGANLRFPILQDAKLLYDREMRTP